MKVPGVLYSLILAVGAWAVTYFTSGDGSTWLYAPILLAVVPILLKAVTVQQPEAPTPMSDFGGPAPEQSESKVRKFLLG